MDTYERSKLADAIHEQWFEKGDYIIKQGEMGDDFFMLMSGSCKAVKTLEVGKPPSEVAQYTEGDYFGERALLSGEARAASIVAENQVCVVYLDRHSFKRLLGPVEEIMKRNMAVYNQFY